MTTGVTSADMSACMLRAVTESRVNCGKRVGLSRANLPSYRGAARSLCDHRARLSLAGYRR
jgi:hypothetical protein